jgi:hypothetical protein
MASNPYVNKVVFGNDTVIDISDSTAVASDVAQGKYFYLATGEKVQGTATGGGSGGNVWQDAQGYVHLDDEGTTPITVEPLSVTQNGTYTATTGHAYSPVTVNVSGGGGLEYEMGAFSPTEDVANYIIPFANTHTTAPCIYAVFDATGTNATTTADHLAVTYVNGEQLFGSGAVFGDTKTLYALACSRYKSGEAASGGTSFAVTTSYIDQADSNNTNSRYWATETGIRFHTNSSSRYARTGRTYKWIAVWAPTT